MVLRSILKPTTFLRRTVPVMSLLLAAALPGAGAQSVGQIPTQAPGSTVPASLIRKAVDIQVANDQQHPPLRYRYTKTTEHGVFVKDVIDTREGEVSRLVAINGKPLGPDREHEEQDRLNQLKDDPAAQARHQRHHDSDQQHIDRMMRELPDAFVFTLVGTEDAPSGPLWHVSFEPNAQWNPPDRESEMLRGMAGDIWIDQHSLHFVRLQAHLIHDIDFGFGILASFRKGGTVEMANAEVGNGHWEIVHMKLDVDGTALMLKKLSFHIVEDASGFQMIPPMDYREAVDALEKSPELLRAPTATPAP